jgi:hypothetical protein
VFLAGIDGEGDLPRLTLHTAPSVKRRPLKLELERALHRDGLKARCQVRSIDHRRLGRATSLERVLRAFPHATTVYDPTSTIGRSRALLNCAERLRGSLGSQLKGVFLDAESRTLYLVFRRAQLLAQGKPDAEIRSELLAATAEVIERWLAEEPDAIRPAIRLCAALPRIALVAVDEASLAGRSSLHAQLALMRFGAVAGGFAALFGVSMPHQAQAQAVSDPNGKISIEGGGQGHDNNAALGLGQGSFTLPVGNDFGFQADGVGGLARDDAAWGVGGQFFWRDPTIGLAGVFADHVNRGGANQTRGGVEGEAYFGQFTLAGRGGFEETASDGRGGYGRLDLHWYPIDDLDLSVGAQIDTHETYGRFGVEYQFGVHALPGLAAFADVAVFGAGVKYGLVGLRYYFGADKSLIRRHREDDPPNVAGEDILDPVPKKPPTNSYPHYPTSS